MNGSQLAKALAEIINQKPELDRGFQDQVAKWLKSNLFKTPSLAAFRAMLGMAGEEFIVWYLRQQADKDIPGLTKKLDGDLAELKSRTAGDLRHHLAALAAGRVEPAMRQKPKGGKGKSKAVARTIDEILRLTNSLERRGELEKLSPSDLKAGISKYSINAGSLSRKPSKTEMIEHIQAAIAAGWPGPRSVLDDSKY